jgi:hypothetical protein
MRWRPALDRCSPCNGTARAAGRPVLAGPPALSFVCGRANTADVIDSGLDCRVVEVIPSLSAWRHAERRPGVCLTGGAITSRYVDLLEQFRDSFGKGMT